MRRNYICFLKEGNEESKELLGMKGKNLLDLLNLKISVPRGFIITTEGYKNYYEHENKITNELRKQCKSAISIMEQNESGKFGSKKEPIMLSIRSSACVSMPGMMDTILNVGINDEIVESIAKREPKFAYDTYIRFIQMYATIVKGIPKEEFEKINEKLSYGEKEVKQQKEIIKQLKSIYKENVQQEFPQDVEEQLIESIKAVMNSWNNKNTKIYRNMKNIPDNIGTAVIVQKMVFGNMSDESGTGVIFSENPITGKKEMFGEYIMNAQGVDVVSGRKIPQPIENLKNVNLEMYNELQQISKLLEKYYEEMQDIEFTIEKGKLYILQTRTMRGGKEIESKSTQNTTDKKIISEKKLPTLSDSFTKEQLENIRPIANGVSASEGIVRGKIIFSAEKACELYKKGEKDLILVKLQIYPRDLEGLTVCRGILTKRGGVTSHIAVLARDLEICCIVGCQKIRIDEKKKIFYTTNGKIYHEGDYIWLNGENGKVYEENKKIL